MSGRKASLYFDGCARGNPGEAGAGAVLFDADGAQLSALWKYMGKATNNAAEYEGLICGLDKAHSLGLTSLDVRGDSKLILEQMRGAYRVKALNLKPLYERAKHLAGRFDRITYTWVPRHQNATADGLANKAADMRSSGASEKASQSASAGRSSDSKQQLETRSAFADSTSLHSPSKRHGQTLSYDQLMAARQEALALLDDEIARLEQQLADARRRRAETMKQFALEIKHVRSPKKVKLERGDDY